MSPDCPGPVTSGIPTGDAVRKRKRSHLQSVSPSDLFSEGLGDPETAWTTVHADGCVCTACGGVPETKMSLENQGQGWLVPQHHWAQRTQPGSVLSSPPLEERDLETRVLWCHPRRQRDHQHPPPRGGTQLPDGPEQKAPASSLCAQSCRPQPRAGHCHSAASWPPQPSSSIQMRPTPAPK